MWCEYRPLIVVVTLVWLSGCLAVFLLIFQPTYLPKTDQRILGGCVPKAKNGTLSVFAPAKLRLNSFFNSVSVGYARMFVVKQC